MAERIDVKNYKWR